MKKFIAALFASFMLIGLFSAAATVSAEPGPNGNNDKGLCTAYFNGQKKGHDKHDDPGPFQALEDDAAENDGRDNNGNDEVDEEGETIDDSTADGDLEQAEAVFSYCEGLIGGNPDHGRYDCSYNDEDEPECTRNEAPGGGNGNGGGNPNA